MVVRTERERHRKTTHYKYTAIRVIDVMSILGPSLGIDAKDVVYDELQDGRRLSLEELNDRLDYSDAEIQAALKKLINDGKIAETPDWRYRPARLQS